MFELNYELMNTMSNSVSCYDHVLRREDGNVLRGALDIRSKEEREANEYMEEIG